MTKLLDALDRTCSYLLAAGGLAIFVIVMSNVITRYLAEISVAWANEICQILSVWLAFLGGAKAVRLRSHLGIPELVDTLGQKARRVAHIVALGVVCFVLVVMIYAGTQLTYVSMVQNFSVTQWPVGIMYAALPVGALLSLLFTIEDGWKTLAGKADVPEPDTATPR